MRKQKPRINSQFLLICTSWLVSSTQSWMVDLGRRNNNKRIISDVGTVILLQDGIPVNDQNMVTSITDHAKPIICPQRRKFLQTASLTLLMNSIILGCPKLAYPQGNQGSSSSTIYVKKADKFAYEFVPPSNFDAGNKPLKTHLDEINFSSMTTGGYQYGVTVDPVRIRSLTQFGSPEEVAAKVVMAEVNRDGVFDVTLKKDPMVGTSPLIGDESDTSESVTYYQLNYLSQGKRGDKRFITKFYIYNQFLFALTAQCKEAEYLSLENEIMQTVDSFRIMTP